MGKNNSIVYGKLSVIYIIIIRDKRKMRQNQSLYQQGEGIFDFNVGQLWL